MYFSKIVALERKNSDSCELSLFPYDLKNFTISPQINNVIVEFDTTTFLFRYYLNFLMKMYVFIVHSSADIQINAGNSVY